MTRELNHDAITVRANQLVELRDRLERYCWGVADGTLKPDVAADRMLAEMIRATPAEKSA